VSDGRASALVGIVIVSHSPDVARGAADMVRQMVGDEVPCAHCGGDPEGGLGTDPAKIQAAIEQVWSPAGVAVLVDLGGAEMNAEMVIELLGPERSGRVRVCNAPVVEGAVVAATEASTGSTLDVVCATAEELSP
jgi:dihydroxyacetone kinase phosphotransfer subunit